MIEDGIGERIVTIRPFNLFLKPLRARLTLSAYQHMLYIRLLPDVRSFSLSSFKAILFNGLNTSFVTSSVV
jgi:hypothetical protein